MFLDDFNPSLLKMAVVWYVFAFGIRGWVQLREKGAPAAIKGALLVIAYTALGSLVTHLFTQNYLLLVATIIVAIVIVLISFILCHDGASEHDLKMFKFFILVTPVIIVSGWLILAIAFAAGHYLIDWMRL